MRDPRTGEPLIIEVANNLSDEEQGLLDYLKINEGVMGSYMEKTAERLVESIRENINEPSSQ